MTKFSTHYYCGSHEGQVEEFYKCNSAIAMVVDVCAGLCDWFSSGNNIIRKTNMLLQALTFTEANQKIFFQSLFFKNLYHKHFLSYLHLSIVFELWKQIWNNLWMQNYIGKYKIWKHQEWAWQFRQGTHQTEEKFCLHYGSNISRCHIYR